MRMLFRYGLLAVFIPHQLWRSYVPSADVLSSARSNRYKFRQ